MTPPQVVVLDTRGAHDQAAFRAAFTRSLDLPQSCGQDWEALSECLQGFLQRTAPVLVVWTGASHLTDEDRGVVLDRLSGRFESGADLLIVDEVAVAPQPDFALDHVQLAIPPGQEPAAREYWVELVGLTEVGRPAELAARGGVWLTGEALELHLGVQSPFTPAGKAHPGIMVRDFDLLRDRLVRAGHPTRDATDIPGRRRFHTQDPFGNRIEFIAF